MCVFLNLTSNMICRTSKTAARQTHTHTNTAYCHVQRRLSFPIDPGTLYVPEVFCPEFLNEQLANVTVGGDSQLLSCCAQLFSR